MRNKITTEAPDPKKSGKIIGTCGVENNQNRLAKMGNLLWKEICNIATIYLIGFFCGFGFLCGIVAFLRLAGK
jgi:hypothetical protein